MAKKPIKKSLKQRMKEKKDELKKRGSQGGIIRQKEEGTMRVRVLPTGEDNDFVQEIIQFWLGKDIKGVISPQTFGEPCAIMEKYQELKNSSDEDDKELAKSFVPRTKYVIPIVMYKDEKGRKLDKDSSGKLLQIAGTVYQQLIDLYLDEDEAGDMTDPKDGYDVKITREGLKMMDTVYSVRPCKPTKLDKAYKTDVDLEDLVRAQVDSYEQTVTKIEAFLGLDDSDDDKPTKKKKKSKGKKSKKRRKKDI